MTDPSCLTACTRFSPCCYCFLTAFPLFLHSLPPLISNCFNLHFRTHRSRKLKFFSCKQETGVMERLLYLGRPHRVLLGFNPPFSLMFLNLEGNRCRTRKGIRFWIERSTINLEENSKGQVLGALSFSTSQSPRRN